jgi:hypothetical protein
VQVEWQELWVLAEVILLLLLLLLVLACPYSNRKHGI